MDRSQWRKERRLWNEVQMDTIYARQYDQHWGGYINTSHRHMLERFLDLCPPGGSILDVACGTGKYWSVLLERGFSVQGTDQSQQMLHYAHTKFPDVPVKHTGMQELSFVDTFDGVICMDALEMAFPEDWPLILHNFAQALHQHSPLYFTVEIASKEELDIAYEAGQRLGLPLLYGEYAHHGGYHYYPTDEQVQAWLAKTPFALFDVTEGDGYRHYLVKKQNG